MKQSWSFVTIRAVRSCYLDAQYAPNRPRKPFTNRSSIARKKIATEAPAIAPDDDGAQDSNKTLSPPLVWKYGIIIELDWPDMVVVGHRGGSKKGRKQGRLLP
jgi:hypothetical protein